MSKTPSPAAPVAADPFSALEFEFGVPTATDGTTLVDVLRAIHGNLGVVLLPGQSHRWVLAGDGGTGAQARLAYDKDEDAVILEISEWTNTTGAAVTLSLRADCELQFNEAGDDVVGTRMTLEASQDGVVERGRNALAVLAASRAAIANMKLAV